MANSTDEVLNDGNLRTKRNSNIIAASLLLICLLLGIGVGVFFSGSRTQANEPINANLPESLSSSFADVARQVEPAVVNIDTKGKVPEIAIKGETPSGNSNDATDFFRRQSRRPSYAVGSGFIVDKSGYILTNQHVVDDASRITVRMQNGDEYSAKVIGVDKETDLAVLKVDAGKDLPSVKMGDSNSTQVGDWF